MREDLALELWDLWPSSVSAVLTSSAFVLASAVQVRLLVLPPPLPVPLPALLPAPAAAPTLRLGLNFDHNLSLMLNRQPQPLSPNHKQ